LNANSGAKPLPAVGVGGIVFDDQGRVLLIRRGQPPAKGQWSLPGGRMEPGETMQQTCRREYWEETGLSIRVGPVVALVERRIEGFHYVIVDFLAELESTGDVKPQAAGDALDAQWIPLADMANYPLVGGLHPILLRAEEMRRGVCFGLSDSGSGIDFLAVGVAE
jgi:ADP-ribose pyrophosphatase YjhB (NUDIX family)